MRYAVWLNSETPVLLRGLLKLKKEEKEEERERELCFATKCWSVMAPTMTAWHNFLQGDVRGPFWQERNLGKGAQPNFDLGKEDGKGKKNALPSARVDVTRTRVSQEKLQGGIWECWDSNKSAAVSRADGNGKSHKKFTTPRVKVEWDARILYERVNFGVRRRWSRYFLYVTRIRLSLRSQRYIY